MKVRLLAIFWFAIAMLVAVQAHSQPGEIHNKKLIFDQLLEVQSLSQSSINCILQDSEGYLWIGTWSGLIRYDGYTTTVFHSENQPGKLQSNKILTLYEDQSGFLWIGNTWAAFFDTIKVTTHLKNLPTMITIQPA